jgi:two-component system sensor histidine kinase UhpB
MQKPCLKGGRHRYPVVAFSNRLNRLVNGVPMSLRFRLIGLVCVILLASLALGGVIACVNASRSVRIEMHAALRVGRQTIENAIERLRNTADPSRDLKDLIASFRGNRHLRVWLIGAEQSGAAPSVESSPFGGVPLWFARIIAPATVTDRVPIAVGGHDYGIVAVEPDPHNELLEVWNEFAASVAAQAVFYGLTILMIYVFVGRALQPLAHLAAALEQVGDGRYRTRISGRLAPELARLRDSFNRMAARLASSDAENRRLNERLLTLQEQERCDLARDLHDEVSPYLFAINVDAATASRLLREGRAAAACDNLDAIIDAVRHTQRQVRVMLGRLRPIGFAGFGLREAIENIVAFWRRRRPEIRYQVAVCAERDDLGELVGTTICRIVQECLSNAVRHAEPATIAVSVARGCNGQLGRDQISVEVADDGCGMPEPNRIGYGLLGVRERVKAVGGELTFTNRPAEGFAVTAVLPCAREPVSP